MLLVCTAEAMVVANWTKREKGIRFGGDGRRETENLACTYECLRGRRSRKDRNSCVCVCVCVCLRAQCVCLCQIVFQDLRSKLFFHRLDEVATAPTAGAGRAGSSGFLGSAPMAARLLLHCL